MLLEGMFSVATHHEPCFHCRRMISGFASEMGHSAKVVFCGIISLDAAALPDPSPREIMSVISRTCLQHERPAHCRGEGIWCGEGRPEEAQADLVISACVSQGGVDEQRVGDAENTGEG
jgi:hypothetical protein